MAGDSRYDLDDACFANYAGLLVSKAISYASLVPYYSLAR